MTRWSICHQTPGPWCNNSGSGVLRMQQATEEDLETHPGRGRARERAQGQGVRGLGRGVLPPEVSWRPVNFNDDFDLNWVGEPQRTGILVDTSEFQPVNFFKYFFPDSVFDIMTTHTNLYARQYLDNRNFGPYSRYHKWSDKSPEEMKAYIALQVAMGINSKLELPDYWGKYWLTTNKFSDVMSRNGYQLLTTFLHFNDNEQHVARGQEGYDPLFKVRPLLDITDDRYTSAYAPDKELSIDESMIKFKGRIFFRQYLPAKPTKWGIKTFALCESNTGYALKFLIYTGKNTFDCDRNSHFTVTEQVCLQMMKDYENNGYTLYTDNYYSSPQLLRN